MFSIEKINQMVLNIQLARKQVKRTINCLLTQKSSYSEVASALKSQLLNIENERE